MQPTLIVTQQKFYYHPPFEYTSRIHLVFKGNNLIVNILGVMLQSGSVNSDTEVHELCKMFTDQSAYKFCQGIGWDFYKEYCYSVTCYHLKSVKYCAAPFQCVDSVNCKLWYKLSINAPLVDKHFNEVMCSSCERLKLTLNGRESIQCVEVLQGT